MNLAMATHTEFASTKFILAKVCIPGALSRFTPVVACNLLSVWGLQAVDLVSPEMGWLAAPLALYCGNDFSTVAQGMMDESQKA